MIFLPEHAELIRRGLKWQTRRLVEEGDKAETKEYLNWRWNRRERIVAVRRPDKHGKPRLLYRVGNIYAICPGRGKLSLCRRKLLRIRQQQLQYMLGSDAEAEGMPASYTPIQDFFEVWDRIHTKRGTRSEDNPEVWVLTFERKAEGCD